MALTERMNTSTMALWVVASLAGGWCVRRVDAQPYPAQRRQQFARVCSGHRASGRGNLQDRLTLLVWNDADAESQMLIRRAMPSTGCLTVSMP
jgi:hypothetical protein